MPPARLPWSSLTLCLWLPCLAAAKPAGYTLDPVHTRVLFAVGHAGFSQALGTVSGSTGTLLFDPGDWSAARLQVSVPIARLDLGDAQWNRAVGARNLLDVQQYPVASFVSTRIVAKDATHASVCGTLQLRGTGREVCLDVTLNQLKRHPLPPFRRTAGFSATTTISRKDFGITAWPGVIGDAVTLRIEAEATRSGRANSGDSGDMLDHDATAPPAASPSPDPSKPGESTP